MADITVQALDLTVDWERYADLANRAFGPRETASVRARTEPMIADGRALGAFDGERLIGAALYHDMRQWWHGRPMPMAGVSGVKVAPEYRGRGAGRAMMTALIALMAERGYLVSVLYAATAPIYRQLGWERAGARYEASLPGRALLTLPRVGGPAPRIRRPGPEDAAEVLRVTGHAYAVARDSGTVTFSEKLMRTWLTPPGPLADKDKYAYLAPDGFLAYHWHDGGIYVNTLVAASAETTSALWSIVASHSSTARTVRAMISPADPLWWLLPEQDATLTERYFWMLRLLDAPAAIAARGFPQADVSVRLEITDDQLPGNAGRWDLTVRSGSGHLSRTTSASSPAADDLALGPRGLAALYAGTPMATLRRSGLATGGTPADDTALDTAFAATPYMLDDF